jgi:hypothetical protein
VLSADLHLVECACSIVQSILENIGRAEKQRKIVLKMGKNQQWQEIQAV